MTKPGTDAGDGGADGHDGLPGPAGALAAAGGVCGEIRAAIQFMTGARRLPHPYTALALGRLLSWLADQHLPFLRAFETDFLRWRARGLMSMATPVGEATALAILRTPMFVPALAREDFMMRLGMEEAQPC